MPAQTLPDALPPFTGLGQPELDAITAVLAADTRWSAVPHPDPDGEVSAMVLPSDDALPAFVVHREGALLRLDAVRGDAYDRMGAFPALAPLLGRLLAAMAAEG